MADDICQCPKCGRMHRDLGFGSPPESISSSVPDVVREWEALSISNDFPVWKSCGDRMAAALTAQAAEVERLTGEVENLGQALAYQESLIPAEEVAHLRDRATTAEASLETARGALEGLRKQIADEVRNRDLGEVRGISLGDEATLIGVVNEFRKLTAHEIADFIDGTPPHVITDIDRDLPTVQYDAAWPDDKKAEALAALPSPPITKGPKP